MNTITNFRMNQPTINQRSNKLISNNQNSYTPMHNQPAQNVQFKGLNLRVLKAFTPAGRKMERAIAKHNKEIANILQVPSEKINTLTHNAPMNRLYFLDALTSKFHSKYGWGTNAANPEKSDVVFNIYEQVKNPQKDHFYLAERMPGKMEKMGEVFELIGDDSKKLKLAKQMQEQVLDGARAEQVAPNLMTDVLKSDNADLYSEKFVDYKPYFSVHKKDENAVANLDRMVTSGTYDKNFVKREANLNKVFAPYNMGETSVLNAQVVRDNYTQEGQSFLEAFDDLIGTTNDSMKAGNDKQVLNMFLTTTKENLDLRRSIMQRYSSDKFDNIKNHDYNEKVADLNELFTNIDSDKHAKNYVQKLLKYRDSLPKAKSINTLFNRVSTKKLDIFFENAQNIMGQVRGEKRYEVLNKEITHPLFMTPERAEHIAEMKSIGLKEGLSLKQKIGRVLKNQINKIRYGMSEDKQAKIVQANQEQVDMANLRSRMEQFIPSNKSTVTEPAITSVEVKTVEAPKSSVVPVEAKAVETVKTTPVETVAETTPQPVKKKAIRHFNVVKAPKTPNAKKLAVINDVNQIIEKKLGSKTLADQKRDYAITATKMRMQMLPEIFESIKETRAMERAAGVKKPSVSNKDALSLYSKINGRNKKLVNYMLKKRNADGTRTFKFDEILSTIQQSESKLHKQKFASPKTYKAADGKAYYANLLETQIQEHGKLQRTKKS